MESHVTLLQDLAIVSTVSGVFALIAHMLKTPLMIGYMIGGFLLGPHFFSNWIGGAESIEQISELGVIFLMFYIGLEFDLTKLKKIFVPSAFWLTLQTVGMVAIGLMVAPMLGWTGLNGLFLGSMLVMSSTMITIPMLKARNALNTEYAQCAIGCLIMEDILAIIFLVVLSGIAVTGRIDPTAIRNSAFIISVFVVTVFCVGKLLSPYFTQALFKAQSSEVLAVAIVGFMMSICLLASYFKFSVALGAFLAGSILSRTSTAENVEKLTEPLRNVFNAVFFTSVGMMIDVKAILHFWPIVLLLTLITFAGQTIIGTIALFLVGKKPETAFKAAFSKSQIGEFSFVIAALGNSLGVLNKDFVSVTVGVAIGTIFICAFFGNKVDAIYKFFAKRTPHFLVDFGQAYHNLLNEIRDNIAKNGFLELALRQLLTALIWFLLLSGTLFAVSTLASMAKQGQFNEILATAVGFLSKIFQAVDPLYVEQMPTEEVLVASSRLFQIIIWTATYLTCIPFLVGIVKNIQAIFVNLIKNSFNRRTQNDLLNNRLLSVIRGMLTVVALFLFNGVFLGIAARYLPTGVPVILFGTVAIVLAIILWHQLSKLNNRMELAFIRSFNEKIETQEQLSRKAILARMAKNNPWPIEIVEYSLKTNYDVIGKQLTDVPVRQLTGATIIAIARGGLSTYRLSPDLQFFPGDKVVLIGTKEQIEKAKELLSKEADDNAQNKRVNAQFDIINFCVGKDKTFVGQILSNVHLRQNYGLNVVGIQRQQEQIVDVRRDTEIREDDILLLAGTKTAIGLFREKFPI